VLATEKTMVGLSQCTPAAQAHAERGRRASPRGPARRPGLGQQFHGSVDEVAPQVSRFRHQAGSVRAVDELSSLPARRRSRRAAGPWPRQGYRDGEVIPIELVQRIVGRIAATIDAPVTVDFEGGYSENDSELANNISRLLDLGVIGINFEDRLVKGAGLYDVDRQARRISAIRKAAGRKGVGLFINARTDVFFEHSNDAAQAVAEALGRAKAYAVAGASGYFVPGLVDDALVELRGFEPRYS
jgi:hypothetical protein